jgi:hypothetical protein
MAEAIDLRFGRLGGRMTAAVLLLTGAMAAVGQEVPATVPDSSDKPGKPMTKAELKDLLLSVDSILKFASTDSKLPIAHSVKRTLVTRPQVNQYLTKKFAEDESAKRLARAEIVLKKFGLLDRDFHLKPFMLGLLTEQIAAFYDEKTKTVNLVDSIDADEQKPTLAHELTHALQDQKVGLEKWSSSGVSGVSHTAHEDNHNIQVDELETTREAVTEGQAMVVFVDYTLRDSGKTVATSPEIADRLRQVTSDPGSSPMMARAPLLLQRSLLFPYSAGLGFEQAVLLKKGTEAAFAGVLENPPSSSSEIMHPDAWMAHVPVPVLAFPDVHPLLNEDYEPYDLGVMGELDVSILTELFAGPQMAGALAPAWAGGVYYAAQRKAATAAEKQTTGSLGLMYYSRWKNRDSARSFARVYAAELGRKYTGVAERQTDEKGESEQVYTTSEGDVLISTDDTGVFVSEGFPLALARKLRESTLAVQGTGKVQVAGSVMLPRHELTSEMVHVFASLGTMKAGDILLSGKLQQ